MHEVRDVNPNMIVLARQLRGRTQSSLARSLKMSQGNVSKMEQGLYSVTDETLEALSATLEVPKSFFFESGGIYVPGMKYHRKRKSVPKKTLAKIDAALNVRMRNIQKLLHSAELISYEELQYMEVEEYGSPEAIARALREFWRVPRGPIRSVTSLLEDAGIPVVEMDFETRKLDGLTLITKDAPPIVFINKDIPGDRMRFTLAHELGHIVMHANRPPVEDEDTQADRFAAEFLMPAEEIRRDLRNLNLQKLADLKQFWKVAMSALVKRAGDLEVLTPGQVRYLFIQMSKMGWRTREPESIEVPRETTSLLQELIDLHLNDLAYTIDELAAMLHLCVGELREWYLGSRGRLRLVKQET